MTKIHVAEITDPVTGEKTTLTAETESELEQLINAELETTYPYPDEAEALPAAPEELMDQERLHSESMPRTLGRRSDEKPR